VSARDEHVEEADSDATFDRAKLPLIIAAVGVTGGLAIAGSVERTAGGALVLGAWVLGVVALHRLGRASSSSSRLQAPPGSRRPPDETPPEPRADDA
jgi:hypothetical protein